MLKNRDMMVILPLLTFVSFITFHIFRSCDDIKLTSWPWVLDTLMLSVLPVIALVVTVRREEPEKKTYSFMPIL